MERLEDRVQLGFGNADTFILDNAAKAMAGGLNIGGKKYRVEFIAKDDQSNPDRQSNLAAELILTVPQKHDVELGGVNIGSVKHLPPTLTLQYHFNPEGSVRPYAGIGLNYTRFSSVKLDAGTVLGGSVPLTMDRSSFGWAAQLGVDIRLAPQWFLNLDAKYVKIDSDIEVKGAGVPVTKLDIDPLLLSVGLGYRF